MKRTLLENHKVILEPEVVDREGFLSAIFALKASGDVVDGTTVNIMISHSDAEDGEFESVPDPEVYPSVRVDDKKPGELGKIGVTGNEDMNIDIDLLGCRRFVKITVSFKDKDGAETEVTHTSAVVLGDSVNFPV